MKTTVDISYTLLYTVYRKPAGFYVNGKGETEVRIIINTSSMIPIYEQIADCVKKLIVSGELQSGDALPSVRQLAQELRISALTVKKAYDRLEEEGFAETIHGKGTQVSCGNLEMLREQRAREAEDALSRAVERAQAGGLTAEEIRELFELIMEEQSE